MACRCNCPDYRTHIRGINIGNFPTQTTYTERKWDKDMTAFKSMRDQGLTPGRLEGAYVMERSAKHPREIEAGRPFDKETLSMMDDHGV